MARPRAGPGLYSYVHADTTVDGAFAADGRARVDGRVHGTVDVGGVLQVGPTGHLEGGPVRVRELHVAGTVRASLVQAESVEIWRGGRLEADVRSGSLAVENGGTFVGRRFDPDGTSHAPPAAAGPGDDVVASRDA